MLTQNCCMTLEGVIKLFLWSFFVVLELGSSEIPISLGLFFLKNVCSQPVLFQYYSPIIMYTSKTGLNESEAKACQVYKEYSCLQDITDVGKRNIWLFPLGLNVWWVCCLCICVWLRKETIEQCMRQTIADKNEGGGIQPIWSNAIVKYSSLIDTFPAHNIK